MVLFTGIQASGKSTFYRDYFFNTHVRINLDMLRTRHRESILFRACLESKTNCVIDNTNPAIRDRERYIVPAKMKKFEIIGYYFYSDLESALKRNRQREKVIPDIGLYATSKKLQVPSLSEGFDRLYEVWITENKGFAVKELARL